MNLIKETDCITVGGNQIGVPCKFPFMYNAWDDMYYTPNIIRPLTRWLLTPTKFDSCTDYQTSGTKWCATNVTSTSCNEIYQKNIFWYGN